MDLPADSHVHSEWSWDTGGPRSLARGTMQRTCERALKIGLPAVVFTEHLDFDGWEIGPQDATDAIRHLITPEGILDVPTLDVAGYFDSIDRCRRQFPSLQILTGVEFGQPHLFDTRAAAATLGSICPSSTGSTARCTPCRTVRSAVNRSRCSGSGRPIR